MSKFLRALLKAVNVIGLLNLLGGLILTIVLGSKAWKQTAEGRRYRLCAGSLVAGVIVGYFFYAVWPTVLSSLVDPAARGWIAFTAIPIVLLACTFYLESLRVKLDRPTSTGAG
jgi:hypothetical protein